MQDLLSASSIGFYYEPEKWCFKDVSFSLCRGEVMAILGLNGQGKSTLLSCLLGANTPKTGSIGLNGTCAFLPQSFSLSFNYTCLDIVIMGRARDISTFSTPSDEDKSQAIKALNLLDIAHLSNLNFNSLSGGQKQLVLFAKTIASSSDVMFLDEPASALDLANQDRVLSLILKLKNGLNHKKPSIVFSTHQPNHALAIADKTLILMPDLSYAFGKTSDILTEDRLKKLYSIDIKEVNINSINTLAQIFSAQKYN